ncbi:hypothetical protein [Gordonia sp. VNK21]|uniref:hypothetical protein n=1 Tax=Gordonia sp. VNK21 TaxID=3382483 RepID=UPI0038D47B77
MSNKVLAVTASVLLALIAALLVVARRSRTEHPPVSPTVPRIEDLQSDDRRTATG